MGVGKVMVSGLRTHAQVSDHIWFNGKLGCSDMKETTVTRETRAARMSVKRFELSSSARQIDIDIEPTAGRIFLKFDAAKRAALNGDSGCETAR